MTSNESFDMSRLSCLPVLGVALCLLLIHGCAEQPAADVSNMPGPPDDAWFQANVVDKPTLVVVDFYADWCGPCRQLSPLLVKLEQEYSGQLEVVKVNVDEREALAAHYGVSSIPMVLVTYRGDVLDAMLGNGGYAGLEKLVEPHLGVVAADISDPSVLKDVE